MLRVCLRKHHELGIGRVAFQLGVVTHEIVNFVVGQGQAKIDIGHLQGRAAVFTKLDDTEWRRLMIFKQQTCLASCTQHGLGHAVEQ